MKPDWSSKNVPDWAMYAAQEASGSWYWYSDRPTYSEICTEWQTKGQRQIIPKVELRPQETLEERPRGFWEQAYQATYAGEPTPESWVRLAEVARAQQE